MVRWSWKARPDDRQTEEGRHANHPDVLMDQTIAKLKTQSAEGMVTILMFGYESGLLGLCSVGSHKVG